MLGNALAGIVTQMTLSADATQLFASGLTSAAMIMSTAGPWGMAAGLALQTLTMFGLKYKQAADEAEKAAERQAAAQRQTLLSINNLRAAEDDYSNSAERSTAQVEARIAALQRQIDRERDLMTTLEETQKRQDDLQAARDAEAVERGDMTKEEASAAAREREEGALFQDHVKRLDEEDKALQEAKIARDKAIAEYNRLEEEARRTRERYEQGKQVKAAESRVQSTEGDIESIDKDISGLAGVEGAQEEIKELLRKRREAEAELARQKKEAEDQQQKAGLLPRVKGSDASDPRTYVDLDELRKAAEAAERKSDEALPKLSEDVEAANEAVVRARNNRSNEEYRYRDEKEKMEIRHRQQVRDEEGASIKAAESQAEKAESEVDKQARTLEGKLGDMADKVRGVNANVAAQFDAMAKALSDGASTQELNQATQLIAQFSQTSNEAFNAMAAACRNAAASALAAQQVAKQAREDVERLRSQMRG